MALIRFEFFSYTLMRTVPVTAILPADNVAFPGKEVPNQKPFQTLYLLHGIFGSDLDWVSGTNIQKIAQSNNLAVIMPSGENHFYVNAPGMGFQYGDFIGQELVEVTRRLFHLSDKREDTFIGGLSMGGYGALINGLKHCETFSHIAMLSAALVLDTIVNSSEDAPDIFHNRNYFKAVFGDPENLTGSDNDYKALLLKKLSLNAELPKLFMTIGTEDFLLDENRDYHDFLLSHKVPVDYFESSGKHDWEFWSRTIYDVIDWLPLSDKINAMNSGNVQ